MVMKVTRSCKSEIIDHSQWNRQFIVWNIPEAFKEPKLLVNLEQILLTGYC